MKGWNPSKKFSLLEERATRIRENQEAIKAIEDSWHMEEPSQIQEPQGREEEIPFPTTVQKFQALQTKGQFIQDSPVILGSYQQKKRSSREKQEFFQPEEERSRPLDEETHMLSPRGAKNQK
ncbi:hypothetical protein O181_080748 [Austropuccinia psidii MF-1]|uniref:Uncharacterized protein n=1 Tax=Austropuccinia psidii MF-1 TaxID=1389203 RepID=A0A9Q3FNG5_9BASI|nr:hypothetical protein [Austropuccinia psidii MF-1]